MNTKSFMRILTLVAVVLMATCGACAKPAPDAAVLEESSAPGIVQGDTVEVMSQAMGRAIKNTVIVPAQYFDEKLQEERYPVLYLLHGAYGEYNNWAKKTDLDAIASQYGVIIVCPDGQDSWYFDSPIDPKMQFETYISKELVAYIDNSYRTYDSRYMRAITGLSMGGHGALYLAWRHPDVFWSCGSMSGGVDITNYPDNWHIKDRLGEQASNRQRWHDNTVTNMVGLLKASDLTPAQNIIIDDGLNDIFIKDNIALHDKLVEAGIDHDFTVRPGRHSWDYWINSLDYHILFFSKAFARGIELMNQDNNLTNTTPQR